MKREHIVTYSLEELKQLQATGKTRIDWKRVDALTDADIEAAAQSDPDAPPTDRAFWREAVPVVPGETERISLENP